MNQVNEHIALFGRLIDAMRAQGFDIKLEQAPKLDKSETDPAKIEQFKRRLAAFNESKLKRVRQVMPAMTGSKQKLRGAMDATGWRPVATALFPKEEYHNVKDKKTGASVSVRKTAYHIEARHRFDDKTRARAVFCPQDGVLELLSHEQMRKAEPVPVPDKKDKRSPLVQSMDRKFRNMIPTWVRAGMNQMEAIEACVENLCVSMDTIPEHMREKVARKLVKSWGNMDRELEGLEKYRVHVAEWVPAGTKQGDAVSLCTVALAEKLTHLPVEWRMRTALRAVKTWGDIGREDEVSAEAEAKALRKQERRLRRIKAEDAHSESDLDRLTREINKRVREPMPVPSGPIKTVRVSQPTLLDRLNNIDTSKSQVALAFAKAVAR